MAKCYTERNNTYLPNNAHFKLPNRNCGFLASSNVKLLITDCSKQESDAKAAGVG